MNLRAFFLLLKVLYRKIGSWVLPPEKRLKVAPSRTSENAILQNKIDPIRLNADARSKILTSCQCTKEETYYTHVSDIGYKECTKGGKSSLSPKRVVMYTLHLQWTGGSMNGDTGQGHRESPLAGGVRLNLPECTLNYLVSKLFYC